MSLGNFAENLALTWLFTAGAATRPTEWHVALFTTDPTDAASGTEVSGAGYGRQTVSFTVTGNQADNSATVSFTASGGTFGTVSHIGVFDASTAGNLLFHGNLTTPKEVADGDTLQFTAGNISITMD